MKEIKPLENETLEEAYNKLISASRYQQVYMVFKGVRIHPDLSLDEAYKSVYGCTKEKFELRRNRAKLIPADDDEKESVFDDTARSVITDVRAAKLIGDIDPETGLYRSIVAINYIRKMSKYAKYCWEDKKDEWNEKILDYIYSVGKEDDEGNPIYTDNQLIGFLEYYEMLGKIMKAINDGKSWIEIKALVVTYSISKKDIDTLISWMRYYSPSGDDFAINVFNKDPKTYKLD